MALNIKDGETVRLVRELAAEAGESMTAATRTAIRERLERVRSAASVDSRVQDILRIGEDVAERLDAQGARLDTDHLYDADGMPR